MVTNQDNLGTNLFPFEKFKGPHDLLIKVLNSQGINFEKILICPHGPKDECICRKPKVGLFNPIDFKNVNFEKSFVVGDRVTDLTLAIIWVL